MNDPKVEAYCESIDNVFLEYMTNSCSEADMCKRVGSNLTKISETMNFPKTFRVVTIDGKNEFCGIKVYPDLSYLAKAYSKFDEMSAIQFCKNWLVTIKAYVVEIDVNCFNKHFINFTNKELTAMLLHEMTHVAFNSTIPELIYNSYRVHREEIRYGNKSAVRVAQQIFYAVPTLLACGMHVIRTGADGKREEYIADKILGVESYRPHLYSAIDKIIRAYGTSTFISEDNCKKTVDNLIEQSNVNIKELSTRRRIIKDELLYQSANTHSKSVRKAYIDIMARLGIGFTDRYTNATIATESVLAAIDSGEVSLNGILTKVRMIDTNPSSVSAIECAFDNTCCEKCCCKFRPKLPTGYEVELIGMDIDKIHTNIDKLAVLDELYKLKEKAEYYTDYAKQNGLYDLSKYNIDKCNKCLDKMIDHTKSKEVEVSRFNNLLDYPIDYSK